MKAEFPKLYWISFLKLVLLDQDFFSNVYLFYLYLSFLFPSHICFIDPYSDPRTRKRFFEKYAREVGFDPLIADNWYAQSHETILAQKVYKLFCYIIYLNIKIYLFQDISKVISYHDHSVKKALITLFPTIGLQKQKFKWFRGILIYF